MANPDIVDVVVIGAGVIGLAVARACSADGLDTLVLEQHAGAGTETSARNSGVIHSGIYYPAGSLKARLCVAGKSLLYAYCEERGIAHRRCGKLIVAQAPEVESLRALHARAVANGVTDLVWLDAAQVRALEPEVRCAAGLHSPSTGIVDPHELMTALQGDLEATGGTVACHAKVKCIRHGADAFEVTVEFGDETTTVAAHRVVNCAGLGAIDLTRRIDGYPADQIPAARFAKGSYFTCSGRPFRRLVYPMPNDAGLGVHATIDMAGDVRFGPDVEWTESLDYAVDPSRAHGFYAAIREYWPSVPDGALQPGYAGIRPKLSGPGETARDFVVAGPETHGIDGLINLLGIESPGLTSTLAIGQMVRRNVHF